MQLCYFSPTTGLIQYFGNIRPFLEQSGWLIFSYLSRVKICCPDIYWQPRFQAEAWQPSYFVFGERKEMAKLFTATRRRNNRVTDLTENLTEQMQENCKNTHKILLGGLLIYL